VITYSSLLWDGSISTMLPFLRQVTWVKPPDDDFARIRHDPSHGILLIPTSEGTQTAEVGDYIVIENDALRVVKKDHPRYRELTQDV
jgi:hypothetical protein